MELSALMLYQRLIGSDMCVFNLKKGSEIITPSLTFSTTVSPIYQLGYVAHFIGVEENKFLSDINQIEKCINKKNCGVFSFVFALLIAVCNVFITSSIVCSNCCASVCELNPSNTGCWFISQSSMAEAKSKYSLV